MYPKFFKKNDRGVFIKRLEAYFIILENRYNIYLHFNTSDVQNSSFLMCDGVRYPVNTVFSEIIMFTIQRLDNIDHDLDVTLHRTNTF